MSTPNFKNFKIFSGVQKHTYGQAQFDHKSIQFDHFCENDQIEPVDDHDVSLHYFSVNPFLQREILLHFLYTCAILKPQ